MKRLSLTLAILAAACSSNDKPEITVFTAAPASVALGGTTQLVFNATAGATLSIDQGVGDVTGKTTATVTPTANTTYTLTASKGGKTSTKTAAVSVTASPSAAFRVTGPAATTAGVPVDFTIAAVDTAGAVNTNYRGTVQFVSDDEQGSMSTNLSFSAADNGQKTVSATFRTAGTRLFVTQDTSVATAQGIAQVRVSAADAVRLDVSGVPVAGVVAGDQIVLTVAARDAFGNVADRFTGTVAFTSSDPAASLPADFTFAPDDKGVHSFTVLLTTAGTATITASSANLTPASGQVTVKHGVTNLSVAFTGADAWAGSPAAATVTAQDKFGNRVTNYTGTVAFTSSDAAASVPANVTFAPADNGQVAVNVTFNTIGGQTLTATDTAAASVTGSGSQTVHGLVYTNPAIGGKVRLVANPASSARVVQLDLVSNTSLFPLTAGTNDTVRNGAFAAGMNLPLDATKVGPDTTLLVTTVPTTVPATHAVLNLGAAPQAVAAAIVNGVLYSGVSQKRIDATAGAANHNARGDVAVRPFPDGSTGATPAGSFYYSLRLKLTPGAAPGTVFDGQALATNLKFRAAVRDRSGSDVFSGTTDFAIGKLEVK